MSSSFSSKKKAEVWWGILFFDLFQSMLDRHVALYIFSHGSLSGWVGYLDFLHRGEVKRRDG